MKTLRLMCVVAVTLVLVVFTIPAVAGPTIVDLTTAGTSGVINGAIFQQWDGQPDGTGVFEPFVRIQHDPPPPEGVEAGYNTDGLIEFETKDDGGHNWTHSLLLNVVPIITIDGTDYREFALDINQNSGSTGSLLSLDEMRIHLASSGDLSGYPTASDPPSSSYGLFGDPIYDLDNLAGEPEVDNWIKLDYDLNHGSGSGDMLAYIPDNLFSGPNPYVYLYSKFGENLTGNDGYEEWATDPFPVIPAPGAIVLGSIGICLVGWLRRRRTL